MADVCLIWVATLAGCTVSRVSSLTFLVKIYDRVEGKAIYYQAQIEQVTVCPKARIVKMLQILYCCITVV